MPRGGHRQWGSRLRRSLWEPRGSRKEAELSGHQQSSPEHYNAATGPAPTLSLNLPPSVPLSVLVGGPGEAGPDGQDAGGAPRTAGRRTRDTHLPPPILEYPGSPLASFTTLEPQISRANSFTVDEYGKQKPANTASNHLDHTHLQPVTKISQKTKTIAVAKAALQVVAAGLKAAPIPCLDQIPNALLALIQIYEVSHPPGAPLRQY
jgi:hypothetical protein